MSHTLRDDAVATNTAAANTFLALSGVYLNGLEKLAALNLSAALEALNSCASATKTLSEAKAGKDYANVLSEIGQPMLEEAVTHTRKMYEIMVKTQQELATVINRQFAYPQFAWADGNALSAMFAKNLQQFGAAAEDNFAAAAKAGSRVVAATTSNARTVS